MSLGKVYWFLSKEHVPSITNVHCTIDFSVTKMMVPSKHCGCTSEPQSKCGCCFMISEKINRPEQNHSACFNITRTGAEKSALFTLQWNEKLYKNETLSAINLPTMCTQVPLRLFSWVDVCVTFSELSWTSEKFGACFQIELKLVIKTLNINLGCWYNKAEQLVFELQNTANELDKFTAQNYGYFSPLYVENDITEKLLRYTTGEHVHPLSLEKKVKEEVGKRNDNEIIFGIKNFQINSETNGTAPSFSEFSDELTDTEPYL